MASFSRRKPKAQAAPEAAIPAAELAPENTAELAPETEAGRATEIAKPAAPRHDIETEWL